MLLREPFLCQGLDDHAASSLHKIKVASYEPLSIGIYNNFYNKYLNNLICKLACNTLYHKRKLVFTVQGVSDQSRRLPQQQGQLANKTENPLKDTLEKTESDAN